MRATYYLHLLYYTQIFRSELSQRRGRACRRLPMLTNVTISVSRSHTSKFSFSFPAGPAASAPLPSRSFIRIASRAVAAQRTSVS
jgi:hypothetical protein